MFQTIERLFNDVKKKKPKGQLLSSATPEFVELKALWQYTCSEQGQVARQCSQLWIQLLKEQCADFTYVLNGFLNQVPTSKNLCGVVMGVSEMLTLQVILKCAANEEYVCPYEIRSPPHPFISIITNRPAESWPLILEQIDRLFTHSDRRVQENVFVMLDPFIKFVLLDPKCSEQYSKLRSNMKVRLVNQVGKVDDRELRNEYMKYLIDLLSKMQVDTADNTVETAEYCIQLLHLYGNHAESLDHCHGNRISVYVLELCQIYQEKNLDSYSLILAVLEMSKHTPEVLCTDVNICTLAQLILQASNDDKILLLKIVKAVLENGHGILNPLCAGLVSMAAINVIATQQTATMTTQHKLLTSLASDVIRLLEKYQMNSSQDVREELNTNLLSSNGYMTRAFVQLARSFSRNSSFLETWLFTIQKHLARKETVSPCLTNLLVSVLIKFPDEEISLLVIDRLSDVVKSDPSQGLYLLPVYLYVIGKSCCPKVNLHVLNALPKLATHKFNVAPVLKTILNLAQSPKMKSLSIKLLTELWALQDRCFPHILKAITESEKGSMKIGSVIDDVTLAKAMAIKEICRLRPEQHGAEMLGPLSELLTSSRDLSSSPVAALCLEALYYVCEAEMIDIMSAWKVLESQLITDTRVVVMVKTCELLSLVPSLQVKTAEYEDFLSESVRRLWLLTQCDVEMVKSAAFSALSKYSQEHFKISHFKYQIVKEFVEQGEAILAASENEGDTIDTVIPSVPGICYTRLLSELHGLTLTGFLDFLSAMVGKEAENLPRGIYFTSLRQQGSLSNQSKELTAIPNFVQSQYDKNKQPGLRASLAVALLFTYDPKIEVGRDGRPRKHYMLSHGKNYQQVFNTLLQDVPVQPSDWYRTSLMGQAWTAFVDRLFSAMLQARKAEIDLQLNRDFIDEKEAEEKKLSAWFWVRDSIMDMIKKSTRGNPSVQFNAVLALSGLARSVHRYISSLDSEERKRMDDVTEHTSHSHWLVIMIDSCMSLIDFTYMPKSTLFGLCQQRSVDDRLPASILAQAAGILALCQIASLIMNNYIELVYQLLDMLIQWLPGKQSDDDCPPVLHFFRSLGLGVFLDQLISSNFTEIAGSKGSLAVWKALDKLEECCLSDSEHRTGALLGLSVSLGTLCQDGKTESRVHISAIHAKLKDALKQAPREHSNFQVLCTCIGLVTGTGFVSNILDKSCFDETLAIIQDLTDTNTQGAGICLALGSLCFAGEIGGHPEISQLKQKLISDWKTTLTKADGTELERVASLYGLVSVMGYNGLYGNDDTKSLSTSRAGIDTVIKSIKDLVTSCDLVGIQATAGWLLGTIYMSASSTNYSSSVSAPGTYSYLQENSILRAVVDFLIQAGKQGPEFIPSKQVEACLVSLQREVTATLPPLNWMGILSPLMKLQFDEEIKLLCIKLAVKLSSSSSSAALFLAAWIVPPLFNTLPVKFQCLLLSSAGHYVKTVTPDVLKSFLDKCCRPVFATSSAETGSKEGRALKIAVLKGLHSSLAVHDPPESVTAMLYDMVEFVYQHTGSESDVDVLINLAECLRNIPDSLLDKITTGDCTCKDSVTRGTFIRSFLVANGNQPITLLNSCIDATFNTECDRDKVLSILVHSFQRMMMLEGTKKPTLQCVQWLHEITGHCRNIAMGTFKLTAEDADISKATQFAVNIIAAAVCLWTSRSSVASLLNINFDLLTVPTSGCEEGSDWLEKCFEHDDGRIDWSTGIKPLNCMQAYIQNLTSEPWNQILQKIVDWHVAMFETAEDIVSKDMKRKLMECLFCLRHCAEFKKLTTWTKAVMFTV
ncbi:focadhesin-like [Ruditapes philippinarum]|uniref:focadhesin-like n=1 Tax=Ruditapes philippinarum TaxID=129788 RepID=UPI00295BD549|nr:focadhesin-like [Ruditapes philippinarum]